MSMELNLTDEQSAIQRAYGKIDGLATHANLAASLLGITYPIQNIDDVSRIEKRMRELEAEEISLGYKAWFLKYESWLKKNFEEGVKRND